MRFLEFCYLFMQQVLIPNVNHLFARSCAFEMLQTMITMGITLIDISCNIPAVTFDNIMSLIMYLSYAYTFFSRSRKVVSGIFLFQKMKQANEQLIEKISRLFCSL